MYIYSSTNRKRQYDDIKNSLELGNTKKKMKKNNNQLTHIFKDDIKKDQ